jgi:hypothetical protein
MAEDRHSEDSTMLNRSTTTCLIGFCGPFFLVVLFASSSSAMSCDPPKVMKEAQPDEILAYFKARHKTVLTLLGYSGADYEDRAALMTHATAILAKADPKTTIVNIGATLDGIGVVYELAKKRGFTTSGIVSTQARDSKAALSPCADMIFFVKDATWGGFVEGSRQLSPTSTAMVGVSDRLIAIGGGEVARDELTAAERAGKPVAFIPADMNHKIARDKASKKGQPAPTDFRGAADEVFGTTTKAPGL